MSGLRGSLREIGAYGVCMVAATGLDFGLLTLQVSLLGVHYVVATIIAFVLANVALYLALNRFVFSEHRAARRATDLPWFIALSAAILGLQTLMIVVAVQTLHVHYLIAKVGAACITFVMSYFLRRHMMGPTRQPA